MQQIHNKAIFKKVLVKSEVKAVCSTEAIFKVLIELAKERNHLEQHLNKLSWRTTLVQLTS